MDLNTLREAAIEATARRSTTGSAFVPSDDSDEWEEEYRRQFAALQTASWRQSQIRCAAARPRPARLRPRRR